MMSILTGKTRYKVYVISSTSGHYKIGYSNNPERRLKELQRTQGPYEYRLEFWWASVNLKHVRELERQLHERFASKRVNGEWFQFSTSDLIALGTLAQEITFSFDP